MSTDSDLARMGELFERLRGESSSQQEAELENIARTEPELATAVGDLLQRNALGDHFLSNPLLGDEFDLQTLVSPEAQRTVTHIGPYELGRPLARGGMGVVYEAWQQRPHRKLALKLLRAGLASPSATRRFAQEVEILGRLRHPGIAQIVDTGLHEPPGLGQSLPWFAMEYVEGARTLCSYAEDEQLDVPARLKLFTSVCDAVHHGHLRGVVHRDLKPDNILVDGDGRTKVIDFGVARVTDADLGLTTVGTLPGELVGTLQYMSPEQREGDSDAIDARSDVYALGVVLFELLTGERPHRIDESSFVAASAALRDSTPRSLAQVAQGLPRDLEVVVSVAMAHDPERRYPSVDALARDVMHVLAHEPLDARPPSLVYRARLFARRHRALASGLVVAVLSLLGGSGFAIDGMLRALTAEGEARGAEQLARISEKTALEAAEESEHQRGLAEAERATALAALKTAEEERGRAEDEKARAERERARADEERDAASDARGEAEARYAEAVAATDYLIEFLGSGHPLRGGLELTVAEALTTAGDQVQDKLAGVPRVQRRVMEHLGLTLVGLGHEEQGQRLLEEALALQSNLGPPDRERLETIISLSTLATNTAQPQEAKKWLDEAIHLHKTLPPQADKRSYYKQSMQLNLLIFFGLNITTQPHEVLEDGALLLSDLSMIGVTGRPVRDVMKGMAMAFTTIGSHDDALLLGQEVVRSAREDHRPGMTGLSMALMSQAHILKQSGRLQDAESSLLEALENVPPELPDHHRLRTELDTYLARVMENQLRLDEAEALFRSAIARDENRGAATSLQGAIALTELAAVLVGLGRDEDALQASTRSVEAYKRVAPPGSHLLPAAHSAHGHLLASLGQITEGEAEMRQAHVDLLELLGADHVYTEQARLRLANLPQLIEAATAKP